MDIPWAGLLQGVVTVIAISLVTRWIMRTPLSARQRPGELYQPIAALGLGLVCFLMFGVLFVLSSLAGKDPALVLTSTVFGAFAAMSLVIVVGYFRDKITFNELSFTYSGLYLMRRTMNWSDVASVRFKPGLKWFLFEDRSGAKARPHLMHVGLPAFAKMALAKVPPDAFDEDTVAILSATASGHPPQI